MARCYSCKKHLGLGIFSRWKNLDGHSFCEPCSVTWFQDRRQRVLQELCRDAEPIEAFRVLRVRTKNPDRPKAREIMLGIASFTNKGVCFLHLARHENADPGWGMAFGLLGAAIAGSAANGQRKESFKQIEQDIRNTDNFQALLERSEQVLYYPLEDISQLKFNSASFTIHMGKLRKRFVYEGGRKAFKQFRDMATAYSRALETGADPIRESQHAITPGDYTNPYA